MKVIEKLHVKLFRMNKRKENHYYLIKSNSEVLHFTHEIKS